MAGRARRGEKMHALSRAVSERTSAWGSGEDRKFALFVGACAAATATMVLADTIEAPAERRPAELVVALLLGATIVAAAWFLRRGFTPRILMGAGLMLMVLGVAEGALLPDSLDAAVVLPVAGAVLALPANRGRSLIVFLAVAFVASMTGVTIGYLGLGFGVGPATSLTSTDRVSSLLESGVLLVFTYGLLWWVGDRWWTANEQVRRALASQRRLLDVNERLMSTLDPQGVLDLIADSLKSVVSYDNLTIYRVDTAAGLLRPVLARDRYARLILESTFPLNRGLTGWVVAHGTAECVNDTLHDPRVSNIQGTPDEAESLIVIPLLVAGEVVGTLNVGRMGDKEAHFSAGEFELARLFAGQASIALRNAETLQAVATRAETDALTGLLNRGAFDERLAALIDDQRARPLVMVMLDLDGFKQYNDVHGHPAGDALLRSAGKAIVASVRDRDLCFRYGGDEFALLLPGTDEETARQIAERVRLAIAAIRSSGAAPITASVGLGTSPRDAQSADALAAATDSALYLAKGYGGDRVETFATIPPPSSGDSDPG
jgi:diguanylate cyclase (GGDEF)-like protein